MSQISKHRNEHRKDKTAFQAMLTSCEIELLDIVKKLRAIPQSKALLLTLLNEEKKNVY